MIYLALAALAILLADLLATASLIRSMSRAHARERTELLNRLADLAGRPYTTSPAQLDRKLAEPRPRYDRSPEQVPDL